MKWLIELLITLLIIVVGLLFVRLFKKPDEQFMSQKYLTDIMLRRKKRGDQ